MVGVWFRRLLVKKEKKKEKFDEMWSEVVNETVMLKCRISWGVSSPPHPQWGVGATNEFREKFWNSSDRWKMWEKKERWKDNADTESKEGKGVMDAQHVQGKSQWWTH